MQFKRTTDSDDKGKKHILSLRTMGTDIDSDTICRWYYVHTACAQLKYVYQKRYRWSVAMLGAVLQAVYNCRVRQGSFNHYSIFQCLINSSARCPNSPFSDVEISSTKRNFIHSQIIIDSGLTWTTSWKIYFGWSLLVFPPWNHQRLNFVVESEVKKPYPFPSLFSASLFSAFVKCFYFPFASAFF